jgi:hypothetical protein
MWNPEARDSSPSLFLFHINEFMGEDQDAAAAREEGDKTEPGEESRLLDWMSWIWSRGSRSLWSNRSGEESTPPLAWTGRNKMPPPRRLEGEEQGGPERPNPLWRRSSLGPRGGVRENYAASLDGYQLGDDPAISRPLY